jgi:hypothetical protein
MPRMELSRNWSASVLGILLSVACEHAAPPVAAPLAATSAPSASAEPVLAHAPPSPPCGAEWCALGALPKQVTFSAVWGSAPNDVWLAGEAGTLLHFNGAAWSLVPSGTESALRALSGTSAKDVWAAGLDGTLLHFDGSSWSATQKNGAPWSPATGPNQRPIYALLAFPRQLWAGGSGTRSFDGGAWTEPHHGSHLPTMAIWGLASSSLWEVGLQGMLNHYDGSHWERIGGEEGPSFYGVWGSAESDVWVVGSGGAIRRISAGRPTSVASNTTNDLHAVCGFGPNDVWAVGDHGTLLHWQGSAWTPSPSPSPSALLSIWGSSPQDIWTVGEDGVVLHHWT